MSWILTAILKWLGSGVLDRVLTHLEARADSETAHERVAAEVAVEHIRAELENRRTARDVLIAEQRHWLTALPRPLFAIPLGIWWTAVIADSLFHFEWNVAALPPPLDEWAAAIVAALFLVDGGERIARVFLARKRGG
jgi:hypothetical protein